MNAAKPRRIQGCSMSRRRFSHSTNSANGMPRMVRMSSLLIGPSALSVGHCPLLGPRCAFGALLECLVVRGSGGSDQKATNGQCTTDNSPASSSRRSLLGKLFPPALLASPELGAKLGLLG